MQELSKDIYTILSDHTGKKYSEIDIIMAGTKIIPPPLGIDCLWLLLCEGWSRREYFFRKGMIFFNAEKQKKYNMKGIIILTIFWIQ